MSGLDSQRYAIFSAPTLVTGGTFTQQNTTVTNINSSKGGFQRLEDEVASAAFHNSAQRVDPPKCHPNTRDSVLRSIINWVRGEHDHEGSIMWLNGAAGAGKSAIAQTLAEICENECIPLASFFFSRLDGTRNTERMLFSTLAYQLALKLPGSKEIIVNTIENDPLIFQRSLATQLRDLIVRPIQKLCNSSTSQFFVVIDGLDECNGRDVQANIVRAIGNIVQTPVPVFFLIASRNEGQITMSFNSKPTCNSLIRVALDDDYLSDDDIRLFLNEKFAEIKETHPLAHFIDKQWPSADLISTLVEKSSGQFIYAAVVIKYISYPSAHPMQRLEIVRGLRPARLDTPFAQLDALYRHIFASMEDLALAHPLLAYSILMRHTDISAITAFFEKTEGTIEAALADLVSLVVCKDEYIVYLHASLPDFLLDMRRSEEYYIDPVRWHTEFSLRWFNLYKSGRQGFVSATDLTKHLQNATSSPELRRHIMDFEPSITQFGLSPNIMHMIDYLSAIKNLNFLDKKQAYSHQCARITRLAYQTNRGDIHQLGAVHNISSTLREIKREEAARWAADKVLYISSFICCLPVSVCVCLLFPFIQVANFLRH